MYDINEIIADQLHTAICEQGADYEPITGILWQDGTPWQLFIVNQDIELDHSEFYRVVRIEKFFYDPDDISALDHADTVLFDFWRI